MELSGKDFTVNLSVTKGTPRQEKLLKAALQKSVESLEECRLLVVGTDHNLLSLNDREGFHLVGRRYDLLGNMLKQIAGIHEFILLNTCNRIEFIGLVGNPVETEQVITKLLDFNSLKRGKYYAKYDEEAFEHFCFVTAGLYSQTPGENHIVAQLKEVVNLARGRGWCGSFLQQWFDSTMHVSKHIRNSVAPVLKHIEIEELTCDYLASHFKKQKLDQLTTVVIGTGEIGRVVIPHLKELGAGEIKWVYHHNCPETEPDVILHSLTELPQILGTADLVVCAATSPVPLLHQGHAPFFDQEKEIHIVDLAIPRNASADLEKVMENVSIMDLDDLKYWYRREGCDMNRVFEIATEDVREHLDYYQKLTSGF